MQHDDETRQLESVRKDLLREYDGRLSAEQVSARFDAIVGEFAGAPVRTFVPVLARRRVRQEMSGA